MRFVSSSSVFSLLWCVSCDVEAGLQPPLHHGRHLNPFPLLAFYTAFTAAQVFNIDQSLLLSPSFITTSFLLFFLIPPHPFLLCSHLPPLPAFPLCFLFSPFVAADQIFPSSLIPSPHPSSFSSFVEPLSVAGCW